MILGLVDCHLSTEHTICTCVVLLLWWAVLLLSEERNIYFFIMTQILRNKSKYETGGRYEE